MFDIVEAAKEVAIVALPVLLAVTFHEAAHGYAAYLLGDPTAKLAGRLTLNPIKHLDVLGTLAFVVTRMFGWAKPVPINPNYFANPRRDLMLVSLAGPLSNFLMAFVFSVLIRVCVGLVQNDPGDTLKLILAVTYWISQAGVMVNLGLGIFNLIPIPPLDGSKVLAGFLPPDAAYRFMSMEKYGFILLIILLVTGMIQKIIIPVIKWAAGLLL